jgi:hypothetical protein
MLILSQDTCVRLFDRFKFTESAQVRSEQMHGQWSPESLAVYHPIMLHLLQVVTDQLRPVDETEKDEEEREEQRQFRYGCGDLVSSVVGKVLGGASTLRAVRRETGEIVKLLIFGQNCR